jgi:choline dehydrogenase-like flavoprotein
MNITGKKQRFEVVVVGGGQAGLAVGYYLAQQGRDFVILEAQNRIGASWRKRWDSLRLFTPAWISSLPGRSFLAPDDAFLTKCKCQGDSGSPHGMRNEITASKQSGSGPCFVASMASVLKWNCSHIESWASDVTRIA